MLEAWPVSKWAWLRRATGPKISLGVLDVLD
jgi:hypothetical protein